MYFGFDSIFINELCQPQQVTDCTPFGGNKNVCGQHPHACKHARETEILSLLVWSLEVKLMEIIEHVRWNLIFFYR